MRQNRSTPCLAAFPHRRNPGRELGQGRYPHEHLIADDECRNCVDGQGLHDREAVRDILLDLLGIHVGLQSPLVQAKPPRNGHGLLLIDLRARRQQCEVKLEERIRAQLPAGRNRDPGCADRVAAEDRHVQQDDPDLLVGREKLLDPAGQFGGVRLVVIEEFGDGDIGVLASNDHPGRARCQRLENCAPARLQLLDLLFRIGFARRGGHFVPLPRSGGVLGDTVALLIHHPQHEHAGREAGDGGFLEQQPCFVRVGSRAGSALMKYSEIVRGGDVPEPVGLGILRDCRLVGLRGLVSASQLIDDPRIGRRGLGGGLAGGDRCRRSDQPQLDAGNAGGTIDVEGTRGRPIARRDQRVGVVLRVTGGAKRKNAQGARNDRSPHRLLPVAARNVRSIASAKHKEPGIVRVAPRRPAPGRGDRLFGFESPRTRRAARHVDAPAVRPPRVRAGVGKRRFVIVNQQDVC